MLKNWIKWALEKLDKEQVHIRRLASWLREQLWFLPMLYAVGATALVWVCALADFFPAPEWLPDIGASLIRTLMAVLTASMLGVATFAVASMVAAYQSVGTNATPRAFTLVVADDISKRALSSFIGAFIFGTIGTIALDLKFYDLQGRFALFVATLFYYGWVILIFMRWVDSIARLGRMGTAISRVEDATRLALFEEAKKPLLGAKPRPEGFDDHRAVFPVTAGYLQDIDVSELQDIAEETNAIVHIVGTPGSFVGPGRAIAYVEDGAATFNDAKIADAFFIGEQRNFASDPRFGFVVLSQIASRALSPGVNDPGTAIDVLGSATRLLLEWTRERHRQELRREHERSAYSYPRVTFPALEVHSLVRDAFTGIARDGAGQVEVMVRLQRNLQLLAAADDGRLRDAAAEFSKEALERTRIHIEYEGDEHQVSDAARQVEQIFADRKDEAERPD